MMDMLRLSVWQINYVILELFSDEILSIFLLQHNVLAAFSLIQLEHVFINLPL